MYVAGANLTVPYFNVVLRKAYGLGAIAMAAGSFDETFFSISWPTGEFAGMGLEGSVKLGRRAELQAITDSRPARPATTSWSPTPTPGPRPSTPARSSRSTT